MNANQPSVLIMAGGTGGHVFPALAAASSLQQRGVHVEWLGTQRGIEARVVPAADIPLHYLPVSGLRGKSLVQFARGVINVFAALAQAVRIIRRLKPVCVLGMGGFVAGPGGLAAWLLRRPLVIHEQNAVAGTTNTLLAPLAKRVLQGYPIALGGARGEHIGNPVRDDIVSLPTPQQRGVARHERLRLLVLGGSLGAKPINECVPAALSKIAAELRPEVRHQAGPNHRESVEALYRAEAVDADVSAFIDDMAQAYSWADLVICRAGALTVSELMVAGVAAILVPLPHAIDDHQTANARWLTDKGAGTLLLQKDMSADHLRDLLLKFNRDREQLLAMASAARSLARPQAAERVADICMEVARV